MENEEKYEKFLKSLISSINQGDYELVKELSKLELNKIKNKKKIRN